MKKDYVFGGMAKVDSDQIAVSYSLIEPHGATSTAGQHMQSHKEIRETAIEKSVVQLAPRKPPEKIIPWIPTMTPEDFEARLSSLKHHAKIGSNFALYNQVLRTAFDAYEKASRQGIKLKPGRVVDAVCEALEQESSSTSVDKKAPRKRIEAILRGSPGSRYEWIREHFTK